MSAPENFRAFAGDPDCPLLLSLEIYDRDTNTATKAPVFERRTLERYVPVERVDAAAEALAVSLNETGAIAWERMAALTGLSITAIQAELAGQVFQNPDGQRWETADEYLGGNVRAKLQAAIAAASRPTPLPLPTTSPSGCSTSYDERVILAQMQHLCTGVPITPRAPSTIA